MLGIPNNETNEIVITLIGITMFNDEINRFNPYNIKTDSIIFFISINNSLDIYFPH